MFTVIRSVDGEIRRIESDGYPIVPVLVGDSFTVTLKGEEIAVGTITDVGRHTFSQAEHGQCSVFGCEPATLDTIMSRLEIDPRRLDWGYRALERLINRRTGFHGTVATLPR